MTQQELASKLRVHKANISRLENGGSVVSEAVLHAIAEATGYPRQFFFKTGSPVPVHLSYRKRQNVPAKLITPIEAHINIIRQHVQELTSVLGKVKPKIPAIEIGAEITPSHAAAMVRQLWGIRNPVVDSMTKVLERQGILVSAFDFETERVDSRSIFTEDGYPVVFFNSRLLGDRLRYSLAFELAQLVLHTNTSVSPERDIGREANEFAAEFLMPSEAIGKDFQHGISLPLLGELKRKWKVSMIALLYRADDLGFLTSNQRRYLLQQFNERKIRRREPLELDIDIEYPTLLKAYLEEYRSMLNLTDPEFIQHLAIPVSDFMKYYG